MDPEAGVFLEPFKAVYVSIPKVACTSLKAEFAKLLGLNLDEYGGDPHKIGLPRPPTNEPISDGLMYAGLFSFAFVRNPWDRLVSCYRDKIRGEVDGFTDMTIRPGVANCLARFDEFVADMAFDDFVTAVAAISDADADPHFRSQHTFVTDDSRDLGVDFVGHFERLQRDFEIVARRIALPDIRLPQLQTARRAVAYTDFYTSRTRNMVAERYSVDNELFGYAFGR